MMAFISYADDGPLDPKLAALYDRVRDPEHGVVDNILRIHAHNPPSAEAHLSLYKTLVHGRSPLSRVQREMIAVVVSQINQCRY